MADLKGIKGYDLTTVRALFDVPDPEMLVETIIPKKTLSGLTAYPGTGKTWLGLELGRAVATGGKFLGKFQSLEGNVVFVGQDASVHDYARQLRKLVRVEYDQMADDVAKGLRRDNPFDDRMHFIIQPGLLLEDKERVMRLARTVLDIEHSEVAETSHEQEELVTKQGTDLIVLDTLFSMTRSDMKDSIQMEIGFRNLRWLAEATGAGILLIHHNSKPTELNEGEDWSGALSQIAALDNWFHLRRVPRSKERLLLKVKKFRGLRPDDFHYNLSVDENHATLLFDGEQGSSASNINVVYDVKEAVLGWLAQPPEPDAFFSVRKISDDLWPTAEDFFGSKHTFYAKVSDELKDSANVSLFEAGPGRSGYRLRARPLDGETVVKSGKEIVDEV